MLGAIQIIAFLLFVVFIVKGIIDIFRKKKWRKSFLFSLISFVVFMIAIINDPTLDTETASNETKTKSSQEEKKQEEKAEKKDSETAKKETEKPSEKATTTATTKTATPKAVQHGVKAKVVRVIDGDTIEVLMDGKQEQIRMLLIDTPETKHPQKPVEKFGPEASQFATETLKNKTVGIQVGKERTDKYGRVLAYVWVGDTTYQEMVLEKGLAATAYLYNDLTMLDEFHKAQYIARNKKIGVWSIPGYAHVDHDHGFHYEEEKKASQLPLQNLNLLRSQRLLQSQSQSQNHKQSSSRTAPTYVPNIQMAYHPTILLIKRRWTETKIITLVNNKRR
ncbi:thermonuclease family protein [Peribacillus sp. FSL R5-0717]|uniref:thermonuclease family protein n=1 Tax=Peribacillus sp. FSL R5-0717 TaxID=2975308 RepID=UPI004047055F